MKTTCSIWLRVSFSRLESTTILLPMVFPLSWSFTKSLQIRLEFLRSLEVLRPILIWKSRRELASILSWFKKLGTKTERSKFALLFSHSNLLFKLSSRSLLVKLPWIWIFPHSKCRVLKELTMISTFLKHKLHNKCDK